LFKIFSVITLQELITKAAEIIWRLHSPLPNMEPKPNTHTTSWIHPIPRPHTFSCNARHARYISYNCPVRLLRW